VSFLLYSLGLIVIVTGLAAVATAIGVSQVYILGFVTLLLGTGALLAVAHMRTRTSA
jgi:hypothetical protein